MPSPACTCSSPAPRRRILGVRVDDLTWDDLARAVVDAVRCGNPHQLVTINTEMLMAARRDAALRDCVDRAYAVAADGIGLLIAARLLHRPLRMRVTGSDGLPYLCALAARHGFRPFILGAAPGVAEEAARRLCRRFAGLVVAGTYAGSPHPEDEDEILRRVREATPDILFVAYGVPAEEKWVARNLERLGVPVAMGVGGAVDFTAGVLPRAPLWLQRLGLEWLYRLYLQPWRWRRMLSLPEFLLLVLAEALAARLRWHR